MTLETYRPRGLQHVGVGGQPTRHGDYPVSR